MRMLELIRGSPLDILFKEQREKEDLEEEMSRQLAVFIQTSWENGFDKYILCTVKSRSYFTSS